MYVIFLNFFSNNACFKVDVIEMQFSNPVSMLIGSLEEEEKTLGWRLIFFWVKTCYKIALQETNIFQGQMYLGLCQQ